MFRDFIVDNKNVFIILGVLLVIGLGYRYWWMNESVVTDLTSVEQKLGLISAPTGSGCNCDEACGLLDNNFYKGSDIVPYNKEDFESVENYESVL